MECVLFHRRRCENRLECKLRGRLRLGTLRGLVKKRLAKNPELDALLREIGGMPSDKAENRSKTGGPGITPIPAAARTRRLTDSVRDSFKTLCKHRQQRKAQIKNLREEVKKDETAILNIAQKYGRSMTEPRGKDLVLFVAPFKAQLVWRDTAGAVDTEAVAQHFPELIENGDEMVDLGRLQAVLETYEVPEATRAFVSKFKAIVQQLEKATGEKIIEAKHEGLLNLERYEEFKRDGKISAALAEKFEAREGNYALRIDKLTNDPRCSACGHNLPKRLVKGKRHTCTRCGHSE